MLQIERSTTALLIDSDPAMLTVMAAALDQQGIRCFLSRNFEMARAALNATPFDLIVFATPSTLPETLDQVALLRRATPAVSDIPIIFLTPRLDAEWMESLQKVGGVYCLAKPFDPQLLIDLVDRALWMPHLVQAHLTPPKAHFAKDWVRLS